MPGSMGIGSDGNWGGYSVKGLTFADVVSPDGITLAKPLTTQGRVAVTNADVKVVDAGCLGTDSAHVAPLSLEGASLEFAVSGVSLVDLTNPIVGNDSTLAFRYPAAGDAAETEERIEPASTTAFSGRTWVTVAHNATVADVVGVSAPHLKQTGNVELGDGKAYFFENGGSRVTCQLQIIQGGWNKCAFLEMTQHGVDVKARVFKANWAHDYDAPLGTDLTTGYTGTSDCDYYPSAFTVHLKRGSRTVKGCSTNNLANSTIVVGTNVMFNVDVFGAIPYNSAGSWVEVEAGGVMNLNVDGNNTYGLNGSTGIRIRKGGVVNQTRSGAFSQTSMVEVDGGVLALANSRVGGGSGWDVGTYLNQLTLNDGGRTTGLAPRVGQRDSTWTIRGRGAPCSHLGGVVLVNELMPSWGFSHKYVWTFHVADVTGDDAPDFTFGGHVDDYVKTGDYYYCGITRRKEGAGTMRISPETWSNSISGRWEIVQGVLQVGASGVITAEKGFELSMRGGTLALEEGVSCSIADYTHLTADSVFALAAGATLELPGAPRNWTAGKKMSITLGEGARVRFGTSKASLTYAQLALISVNGEKAKLDAEGYVKPSRFGTVMVVR